MKFLRIILLIYMIFSVESIETYFEEKKINENLKELSESDNLNSSEENIENPIIDSLKDASLIVEKVCSLYKMEDIIFDSKINNIPMKKGFEYYYTDAIVNYVYDIPLEKIKKIKKAYNFVLDINLTDKKNNDLMDNIFDYIESNEMEDWVKIDIFYQTQEEPNKLRYGSIVVKKYVNENEKEVFQFLLMGTSSTFKLDKTLKMKAIHKDFGVVKNNFINEIIENESDFIPSELNNIIQFYNYISLKAMATYFNLKFQLPIIKFDK